MENLFAPVAPKVVRYVKLGEGGEWEKACLESGVIQMGFGTDGQQGYSLCTSGDWDGFHAMWVKQGRRKGTATRFTNETKAFVEDRGEVLWITFMGQSLYWGVLDPNAKIVRTGDGNSTTRALLDGWRDYDLNGIRLTKANIAGDITSLSSYRGTSCDVRRREYIVRRINGQLLPQVEKAREALHQLRLSALMIIRLLQPRDFELLIDLIFTQSGWRRVGVVGGTQKTLDLDLVLPSTGERAMVQVKSRTNAAELKAYTDQLPSSGPHQKLFFVFHSGAASSNDPRVHVIGPDKVAELTVAAGLTDWVLAKVA